MRRAFGAINHEYALGLEAAALQQGVDALLQMFIIERGEFIEQGRDEYRVSPHHQQGKSRPYRPGVEPPVIAGLVHQPQNDCNQRYADHQHQCTGFDQIHQPGFESGFIEAKALFNDKGGIQREGQIQQAHQYDHAQNHRDARHQWRQLELHPPDIDGVESAANGPDQ